MSRNRYTRLVRIRERGQVARQERQLFHLVRLFRCGIAESPAACPLTIKERRSARLVRNRQYKPYRRMDDGDRSLRVARDR